MSHRTSFQLTLGNDRVLVHYTFTQYQKKHVWDTERHCNAYYELHFILKGSCKVEVGDRQYDLRENQVILIAPGQYHYPTVVSGEFERMACSFSLSNGTLAESLARQVPDCEILPICTEDSAICRSVLKECAGANAFRNSLIQTYLTLLILQIFRSLGLSEAVPYTSLASDDSVRIDEIDNFFEQHFAENASEELLANELHISRRQLARVLQKLYSMNFREKLLSTRMDHAAWLLRTTHRRIVRIAEDVGYTSESAFYQAFRSYFCTTPQQYRQQFLDK